MKNNLIKHKNLIKEACFDAGIGCDIDKIIDEWKQEKTLTEKWYNSLKNNTPDYSIYDDLFYIGEAFWCWYLFSKRSIELLRKPTKKNPISIVDEMKDVNCMIDAGCGLGLTTMMLKSLFPKADVFGTNVKNSFQWRIAQFLGDRFDFKITESFEMISGKHVVVALEYFEHFLEPLKELDRFLFTDPSFIICANTFNGDPSPGHFIYYRIGEKEIDGRAMSVEFNKKMRESGYFQVKTGYWNNRPTVWKKESKLSVFDKAIFN